MEHKVPKHHVKGDICANRPAYREGRIPKAVKVYTVNNESKCILIQGVPAVGAKKELIQLCSSYGEIEEHYVLDEYPCEDKYTEVYLMKYKKIQSARFAKRKLDDYSFFGGNLHICYAPEYETVTETRDKLQERRRTVAAKIRKHRSEQSEEKSVETTLGTEEEPLSLDSQLSDVKDQQQHLMFQTSSVQGLHEATYHNKDLHFSKSQNDLSHSVLVSGTKDEGASSSFLPPAVTFVLPPPPKPSPYKQKEPKHQHEYEYSKVPSKHSTLPPGFDGRLKQNNQFGESNQQILHQNTNSESIMSVNETKVIRKNYKPSKATLKFVPRQAVKRTADDTNLDSKRDDVDKEIRRSAFILADEQGPSDLPGRRTEESESTQAISSSYNKTIKTIRSKISKVITDAVKVPK